MHLTGNTKRSANRLAACSIAGWWAQKRMHPDKVARLAARRDEMRPAILAAIRADKEQMDIAAAKPLAIAAESRALASLHRETDEKRDLLKNAAAIVAKFRDGKNLK